MDLSRWTGQGAILEGVEVRERRLPMVAPMAKTIVVGIDGSQCSDRALHWAITEARATDRPLLLVHVWHWHTDVVASPMSLVGASDARNAGRHLLSRALTQARRQGVTATGRLLEGAAAKTLVKAAEGAAMLVVGSHGHRGLSRAFVGSVSTGCVRQAHCPVVVIPPHLAGVNEPGLAVTGT
jgi:nucleotide-binding universal stress UspA family protein